MPGIPESVAVGAIGPDTDWSEALRGVDCVIHCAGRAHVLKETTSAPLDQYRLVNRDGSIRLAEQAAAAGVRRLIFLSSVGVMGLHTNGRGPFTAFEKPEPTWDYAISKWEAEKALTTLCARTGLELVIIRPPMVYGPNVPANFLRLLKIVKKGIPLPFGAVANRRSMIAIDNLVDLLRRCISHPGAAGQKFMVSDGHDLSTPELIRGIAAAMGRPARLIPVPLPLLRLLGRLSGREHDVERLLGSLQVDIQHTCRTLDWTPPVAVAVGLRKTVDWYMAGGGLGN